MVHGLSCLSLSLILSCNLLTLLVPACCLYKVVAILIKEVEAGACCGG